MDITCPRCRKPFVTAVRRQGLLDHLLSRVCAFVQARVITMNRANHKATT